MQTNNLKKNNKRKKTEQKVVKIALSISLMTLGATAFYIKKFSALHTAAGIAMVLLSIYHSNCYKKVKNQ